MRRSLNVVRRPIAAVRGALATIACQSERCLLVIIVLVGSTISVVTGGILVHYYSVDVISSLLYSPYDCVLDWGVRVGRHCFSDYTIPVSFGMTANPWDPYPLYLPPDFKPAYNNYPAGGMLPHMMFGLLGDWLASPRIGLMGYLLALTLAVFTPAIWAARAARGLEPVVVFVVCGAAAIPAWMVIDRGNSVGFLVPIALAFLVGLCRRQWGLVTVMVILAALVKPQYAVLGVVLFAARQWRWGGIAIAGGVVSNVAAYALWPRDFPRTVVQSLHSVLGYGSSALNASDANVSFGKGLLTIPDFLKAHAAAATTVPPGYLDGLRSTLGYVVLVLVVGAVMVLGRRIPPAMAGIALLATASLFPVLSCRYYLVFALPVAALVLRDPEGPPGTGIFDRTNTHGDRRRFVGLCIATASAVSIAQIALPSPPIHQVILGPLGSIQTFINLVVTSVLVTPLLWLLACVAIIVSYARRPAPSYHADQAPPEPSPEADASLSAVHTADVITELSAQLPSTPQPTTTTPNGAGRPEHGVKAGWVWISDELVAKLGQRQQIVPEDEPVCAPAGELRRALRARRLVLSFGAAAPEGEVPVTEVAQQRGGRDDDRLGRNAGDTELDQTWQGHGVDA